MVGIFMALAPSEENCRSRSEGELVPVHYDCASDRSCLCKFGSDAPDRRCGNAAYPGCHLRGILLEMLSYHFKGRVTSLSIDLEFPLHSKVADARIIIYLRGPCHRIPYQRFPAFFVPQVPAVIAHEVRSVRF